MAALDQRVESMLHRITLKKRSAGWPPNLTVVTGHTEAVIDWCDAALVASGTVTLQVAVRRKPMVIIYNVNRVLAMLAPFVVRSRTFTLPNLISEWAGLGRAVPELVPHFGQVEPVVDQLAGILDDPRIARRQQELLDEIASRFADEHFVKSTTRELLGALGVKPAKDSYQVEPVILGDPAGRTV